MEHHGTTDAMSDNAATVRAGMAAIERADFAAFGAYLADDCVVTGPMPMPVGKAQYLAAQRAILAAMPDWQFNARDVRVSGDGITVTIQNTATHTATLALPLPGFAPVPATGRAIRQPVEQVRFTFRGGKIAAINLEPTPGGGVAGLLADLGVTPSTPSVPTPQ